MAENYNLIDHSTIGPKDYSAKSATVASVKIKWSKPVLAEFNKARVRGVWRMAYDIAAKARGRAPVWSGALRNSIRVEELPEGNGVQIIAGGAASVGTMPTTSRAIVRFVNYAAKREVGPNRNPATEHYMRGAQEDIMSGQWVKQYFGNLTKGVNG